ncbi:hypothetical protein FOG51_00396 [Hanseniaspora uvarum]|nr:hypothetical protein FOG51_00396 [Hanseniaspora uvarum]
MVGLIIPLQSGKPSFHLNYIDDLGIVSIGWGLQNSGDCCSNFNASGQVIQGSSIFSVWTQSGPSGTNVLDKNLLQGVAYPIPVFYLNVGNRGTISVSYIDPNGVNHTDFGGFVYNKKDTSSCAYASITTSTLPWGQSKTSYTTTSTTKTAFVVNKATRVTSLSSGGTLAEMSTLYVIGIPSKFSTLYTTTYWTGTDDKVTTSPIVIIETFTYRDWNSSSVTSSSASYTETKTATCTDHSSQTILSTSSTTTDTNDIETASFTGTHSQPTSSTSVQTDFATPTDTETVSCSDENCQLPPATSFTQTTIETSYVSGSSNSLLSPVSSVAPSFETSSVILSTPALITTANENKAASLKLGGLFILLLQFI